MLEEVPSRLFPVIEIARVVPRLPAAARTSSLDGEGGFIEVYSCRPQELPQLEKTLAFIQCRVCRTALGDDSDPVYLTLDNLQLKYVQVASGGGAESTVQMGYHLTFLPTLHYIDEADLERVREAAYEAASDLLHCTTSSATELYVDEESGQAWRDLPPPAGSPEALALKIHRAIKGQAIRQPFIFTNGAGREITFEGFFAGDQEDNLPAVSVNLSGHIGEVTYRGTTLSFILEAAPTRIGCWKSEKLVVEYVARQLTKVHAFAGYPEREVWVKAEVRETRLATGKTERTYTLLSISDSGNFEMPTSDSSEGIGWQASEVVPTSGSSLQDAW